MEEVPTVGAEFDYNVHEAIQQMPSDEYAEDIVCQEVCGVFISLFFIHDSFLIVTRYRPMRPPFTPTLAPPLRSALQFQKGYTIGGKLVRPAIVAVSIGM